MAPTALPIPRETTIRTELTDHNGRYLNKAVPSNHLFLPRVTNYSLGNFISALDAKPLGAVLGSALNPKPQATPTAPRPQPSPQTNNLLDSEISCIVAHSLEGRPLGPQKSTGPPMCVPSIAPQLRTSISPTGCVWVTSKIRRVVLNVCFTTCRFGTSREGQTESWWLALLGTTYLDKGPGPRVSQIIDEDRLGPLPSDWAVGPETQTHEFCKHSPMAFAESLDWLSRFLEYSPL
jgi:hypothetical protein